MNRDSEVIKEWHEHLRFELAEYAESIDFKDATSNGFIELSINLKTGEDVTDGFFVKLAELEDNSFLSFILQHIDVVVVDGLRLTDEVPDKQTALTDESSVRQKKVTEFLSDPLDPTKPNEEQPFHNDAKKGFEIIGFITPVSVDESKIERINPTAIIKEDDYYDGIRKLAVEILNQEDIENFLQTKGFSPKLYSYIAKLDPKPIEAALFQALDLYFDYFEHEQDNTILRQLLDSKVYYAQPKKGRLYLFNNITHKHKKTGWHWENPGAGRMSTREINDQFEATIGSEVESHRVTGKTLVEFGQKLKPGRY